MSFSNFASVVLQRVSCIASPTWGRRCMNVCLSDCDVFDVRVVRRACQRRPAWWQLRHTDCGGGGARSSAPNLFAAVCPEGLQCLAPELFSSYITGLARGGINLQLQLHVWPVSELIPNYSTVLAAFRINSESIPAARVDWNGGRRMLVAGGWAGAGWVGGWVT